MRFGRALSRLILAAGAASPALAGADSPESNGPFESVMLQAAPGVIHFDPDFDHAKHSWMVGIEWQRPSRWLAGFTYFNNSFDQKSQYLYGGKVWSQRENGQGWYFKLTAGVILGYEEPYEDKIPYNHDGVAPGIVPALGYKVDRASMQFNLLGTAGLMITFGFDVFRWK